MSYLYLISWVSLVVQSVSLTFAIGAGLFYLAEIIEEYASIAKKCINGVIGVITLLAVGLIIFENLPLKLSIITILSNLFYFMSMRNFPFIEINSPVFITSIVSFIIHHYVAFSYFADNYHEFYEVITYFTLFCWTIPVLLLMSLSANDNVLPTYSPNNNMKSSSSENDLVSNYFNRKSNKRYGLLSTLRYFQQNYLPTVGRRDGKSY